MLADNYRKVYKSELRIWHHSRLQTNHSIHIPNTFFARPQGDQKSVRWNMS